MEPEKTALRAAVGSRVDGGQAREPSYAARHSALDVAALPATVAVLAVLVWVLVLRASERSEAKRQSMIAQYLARWGSRLSTEAANRERVARMRT